MSLLSSLTETFASHPKKTLNEAPLATAVLRISKQAAQHFWQHVPAHSGGRFFKEASSSLLLPRGLAALGLSSSLVCDLTELNGLDDLANPTGVIAEAQALTAHRLGVKASYYLVGGSSLGLKAALLAAFCPSDAVLVPRNAHRSVLSGLILADLTPVWFQPTYLNEQGLWGEVSLETLETLRLKNPSVKGLVLAHPTYEGLASPVEAISQWCAAHKLTLLVDEAHGALWPYSHKLPLSATQATGRVDAVIQSVHKTGGSLTQTAVLHLPKGSQLDSQRVRQAINTLQTTSPSYLLLASLDLALASLASREGQNQLASFLQRTQAFRHRLDERLQYLHLFSPSQSMNNTPSSDITKLWLTHSKALNAEDTWAPWAEEHLGLVYERCNPNGALYLLSCFQTEQAFLALEDVFFRLDATDFSALFSCDERGNALPEPQREAQREAQTVMSLPEQVLSPREAFFAYGELLAKAQSLNRISKTTVVTCPPGIPVLLPGERIQAHHLPHLPDTIEVIL